MGKTTTPSSGGAKSPGAPRNSPSRKKPPRPPAKLRDDEKGPVSTRWRTYFLDTLAATSNVKATCDAAGIATARAYLNRAADPEFAAQWRVALAQGYDNLEMELLCYLRNPAPALKMDVAGAIRLLSLHRDSVARQRAFEDHRSEREVLESLDAMIEDMRQRRIAHDAALSLPAPFESPSDD